MIGIIVDGDGDYAAFIARYGSSVRVLKADGPRGHTVTATALVASIRKQVGILRAYRCSKIAVVTDLEGRTDDAKSFRAALRLAAGGVPELADVTFFVADQMLENWLLADIQYLSTKKVYLRLVRNQRSYESRHGKSEIRKLFEPGYDYNEVRHSRELFPLVRGEQAAKWSRSFADFREGLSLD